MTLRPLFLACLLGLPSRASDVPLGLNLPTADRLENWDLAVRFTHRFLEPARGASKDFYGLDGANVAGLGLDAGIGAVPGLNAQVYRTSDGKTLVLALQQHLLGTPWIRMALRAERFDETVKRTPLPLGTVGISGAAFQAPTEVQAGSRVTVLLVPTWLSRTSTVDSGLFTLAGGLRWQMAPRHALLAEYYPRPSRLDPEHYQAGSSLGYRFATRGHRFTLLATSATGTTAHQVLGGDYGGGPRSVNHWTLGFNIVRIF
ncbi:DUF5777 family beta-barrel protein [Mesoterricola silvestris]|uniref:DUF5777 domain-containing protein n=1 Tax=Mesoterricola silvestris TaxID=2927979 RepID=A0AA48H4X6_9BACT|nr:DUF5777 family beta-barrel protein [Mesoterricola silvestris]BDU71943.1 hypothetical protein METEAL_11170 [Mesoterricola silvestris]